MPLDSARCCRRLASQRPTKRFGSRTSSVRAAHISDAENQRRASDHRGNRRRGRYEHRCPVTSEVSSEVTACQTPSYESTLRSTCSEHKPGTVAKMSSELRSVLRCASDSFIRCATRPEVFELHPIV